MLMPPLISVLLSLPLCCAANYHDYERCGMEDLRLHSVFHDFFSCDMYVCHVCCHMIICMCWLQKVRVMQKQLMKRP